MRANEIIVAARTTDLHKGMAEGKVVGFSKKKIDAPQDITGDDVEYAWAMKHVTVPGDKISYQHNGVTIHHKDGSSTFILGGHRPLFDKDPAGKLKFKNDLSVASHAYKLPTKSATKNNVVDFRKKEKERYGDVMKTFKEYVNEAEGQPTRRGFLKGLASFAASAAVPAPVVKLLATPAGVATMPIPAGIALLKGIQDHLDQWDAEDDDDLFDAQEDMAHDLGFDYIEADDDEDGYDISATDQMFDLLDLYRQNPELAAAQLIKHLQSVAINPAKVKSSFRSRANDPSDWRYQNKLKEPDDSEPYDYYASNTPEENKIIIYKTDFDGNIGDTYVRDNRETDPVEELKSIIRSDGSPSGSRFHKYTKFTATSGGKPVKIDHEKYIDPSKLSNALSPDQVREKMYKMWQANIDPDDNSSTDLANVSRLAGLAKGVAGGGDQEPAPTVKDMGPVQYAKDTPALPAPTKPEVDLTPDLKSKEKVPVQRKGGMAESTELSSILKNAGLKTND